MVYCRSGWGFGNVSRDLPGFDWRSAVDTAYTPTMMLARLAGGATVAEPSAPDKP